MEDQKPKKPDDGTLPIVLKIIAVLGILGGVLTAASLSGLAASFSFVVFVASVINAVLLWSLAAIITALRQIEHHTRR